MLDKLNLGGKGTPARLRYDEADFAVLVPGDYVTCAITGRMIPVDELKYWSHARQEPYVDAFASMEAEKKAQG